MWNQSKSYVRSGLVRGRTKRIGLDPPLKCSVHVVIALNYAEKGTPKQTLSYLSCSLLVVWAYLYIACLVIGPNKSLYDPTVLHPDSEMSYLFCHMRPYLPLVYTIFIKYILLNIISLKCSEFLHKTNFTVQNLY